MPLSKNLLSNNLNFLSINNENIPKIINIIPPSHKKLNPSNYSPLASFMSGIIHDQEILL